MTSDPPTPTGNPVDVATSVPYATTPTLNPVDPPAGVTSDPPTPTGNPVDVATSVPYDATTPTLNAVGPPTSVKYDPTPPAGNPVEPPTSVPYDPTKPVLNSVEPRNGTPSTEPAQNPAEPPTRVPSDTTKPSTDFTDQLRPASSQTSDGYQVVDVVAKDGDGAALLKELQSIGLKGGASFGAMASGYLPMAVMSSVKAMDNVVSATPSMVSTHVGKVTNQADMALMTDMYRASTGFDGTGVKIGILSDSFDTASNPRDKDGNLDRAASDIASGDLPAATKVLADNANGTDEGRGMAQIIHDLAPGCSIDFSTGFGGQAVMAQHILDLANDGCKVIVDDLTYYGELMYQDGPIAQAISQVKAMGVSYYSSAGNNDKNGYEGAFNIGSTPVNFTYDGVSYVANQFSPGVTRIPITTSSSQEIVLQWAEPGISSGSGKGSTSDLDLFYTDVNGNVIKRIASTSNNIGGDPFEFLSVNSTAGNTRYLQVGVKSGTAPVDFRIVVFDATLTPVDGNLNTGTSYGHNIADGAVSVAAAPYTATPAYGTTPARTESFSSAGPSYIYFDTAGNRLATPLIRQVDVTGVDGGETTFFGSGKGPNGYPQFFGTSAAAPSAAAVAALMLQKNPTLTPDQIQTILQSTATPDVNSTGAVDPATTGSGLINAQAALAAVPAVCFTTGTRVRTAGGDVAVEDLRVGDIAVTASGALRPITWIGHRDIIGCDMSDRMLPHDQQPIRIRQGAFGPGMPGRDLWLSPGHPVLVGADADHQGGVLVPVMCLINGTTIVRVPRASVTYWHVELDSHDILLAEGLAAESYLDWGDRAFFTEGSEHALHNLDFVVPGLSGRCRPVAVDGPLVEAERVRLDAVFAAELVGHGVWGEAGAFAWLAA